MQLDKICTVFSGYAFKSFNDDSKGMPIIKIGNIKNDGTIDLNDCSFSEECPNTKYRSCEGDIYIALSGATTGKVGIMKSANYLINQRVGIARLNNKNIPVEYLFYFLKSKTEKILNDASGAAQPNISPKDISKYEFELKSTKEMLNIANILNEIVNLINSKKDELTMLNELVKSRFIWQETLI